MRSMTGYSKNYFEDEKYTLLIEIKSVNNKNLNLKIKMPSILNFLENKIRTQIGNKVYRGSIDLKIDFKDKSEEEFFKLNEKISDDYMKFLENLEKRYSEKFSNKLEILIKNSEIIEKKEINLAETEYEKIILEKLDLTLDDFINMKNLEGERLKLYFLERVSELEKKVDEIDNLKNMVVENYKQKLIERLSKIENIEFLKEDLLKEILLFTDRSDISEEVSRLKSHLCQLKQEIQSNKKEVGKKIDFILQEIFRELNTSGVKCNLYDISKIIVESKAEVEKIREQALNIE